MKKVYYILFYFLLANKAYSQDIYISQAFLASQYLSPASVGLGVYDSRFQNTGRTQFSNSVNIYNTALISWDRKIKYSENINSGYLGLGAQIISDNLMGGALQNNNISLNMAYHFVFDERNKHKLSTGIGVTYSTISLNQNKLRFGDQYFSNGLYSNNTTTEIFKKFPSNFTLSTGVIYSFHSENSFLQASANLFLITKPKVTEQYQDAVDTLNFDAKRGQYFMNFESYLSDEWTFYLHSYYYNKGSLQFYVYGGGVGIPITNDYESEKRLYVGCFSRSNTVLIPTINLLMNNYHFGLSYDLYTTNISSSLIKPNIFEFQLSYSFGKKYKETFRSLFD